MLGKTSRLRNQRLVLALAVLATAAITAAGCGGGGGKPPIGGKAPERQPGLIKGGGEDPEAVSAGESESYVPTGEIVADSGFRPETDGFAFENYGNDVGVPGLPQNMLPADVEDLFGTQVCSSGTGEDCELIPSGQEWMDSMNEGMSGGHCQGFSVAAIQFWWEEVDLADYGADTTIDLEIGDNPDLQRLIAEDWTSQYLQGVVDERVKGTPTEVLETLIDEMNAEDGEFYTVGIYKRDFTGGHAITPFAVEDKGDGTYEVLVYDNNFPGVTRALHVDTNEDTWSYIGGPDPSDADQLYEGDAETGTFELDPTSPTLELQPCPFCDGSGVDTSDPATGSVPAAEDQKIQITLSGKPSNHGHLLLRDGQNRVTGFVGDRVVNDIPGVQYRLPTAGQTWNVAPEPTYEIPVDAELSIAIDGSGLAKPDKEKLSLIGPGMYAQVDEINLLPGEKNSIEFKGGKYPHFTFETASQRPQSPLLTSAITENGTAYAFAVRAFGVKGGSRLTVFVDKDTGNLLVDTRGTKGNIAKTGYAVYQVGVVRISDGVVSQWGSDKALIKSGELGLIDYRELPAKGKKAQFFTVTPKGKIRTLQDLDPVQPKP